MITEVGESFIVILMMSKAVDSVGILTTHHYKHELTTYESMVVFTFGVMILVF